MRASPAVRRLIMDSLPLLGARDARGRFPFRPGRRAGQRRAGHGGRRRPGWDKNAAFFDLVMQDPTLAGAKLIAEPWTRRRQRTGPVPAPVVRVERPVPRCHARFVAGPGLSPRWVGARLAGSPDMYATGAPRFGLRRQPRRPSTSSPATTGSLWRTWSPTTRSTTRPTSRAT